MFENETGRHIYFKEGDSDYKEITDQSNPYADYLIRAYGLDEVSSYRYHMPSGQWTKSFNPSPRGAFMQGVWINYEYFVIDYGNRLSKYLQQTDTWVYLSNIVNDYEGLLAFGNNVYVFGNHKLYEYDIDLSLQGDVFYEIPSYVTVSPGMVFTDKKIYCRAGYHYNNWNDYSEFIFCFDSTNRATKSLGAPPNFLWGYDYILPFEEGLYLSSRNVLYEYTGED